MYVILGNRFTWQPKFNEAMRFMDREEAKELCYALAMYGVYGIEPHFPEEMEGRLMSSFAPFTEDIDASKAAMEKMSNAASAKAAKSRKKTADVDAHANADANASANAPTNASACAPTYAGANADTHAGAYAPTHADANAPADASAHAGAQSINQSVIQSINQSESGAQKRKVFTPPTREEVEDFARDKSLTLDVDRFIDYYTAQGWKLSNGNAMKDWKAAARNWDRQDRPKEVELSAEAKRLADLF